MLPRPHISYSRTPTYQQLKDPDINRRKTDDTSISISENG